MKKEELPSLAARFAVLSQRTAKKSTSKKPLHLLFPKHQQPSTPLPLPLPLLAFLPLLLLLTKERLTVSSCSLVFPSVLWGYCPTPLSCFATTAVLSHSDGGARTRHRTKAHVCPEKIKPRQMK